ncbi:MAG: PD-(D/E)XK nuclease family protein, partial [Clostridia bacterium]
IVGADIESFEQPRDEWELEDYIMYYGGKNFAVENLFDLQYRISQNILAISDANQKMLNLLYYVACKQKGQEYIDALINCGGKEAQLTSGDMIWKNGVTSPSQLEKYFNCPFQHYIDYVLKARKREKAELEISDMGTVLHEVAKLYFESENCCDLSKNEIVEKVKQIYDGVVRTNEKLKLIVQRQNGKKVVAELYGRSCKMLVTLVEKMQVTKFRPKATMLEKRFGWGGEGDLGGVQLNFDGKPINIRGIIDRVDFCQDKYLIFDYKSKSTIAFEPKNIVFGERCQMFIYLQAMMNSNITPSGVCYILMSDKMIAADKRDSMYKYIGYVNVDKDNLND